MMRTFIQRLSLPVALLLGLAAFSINLPDGEFISTAEAQSRREERKRKVIDFRKYQQEQSREQYGKLANEKRQEAIAQLKSILSEQLLPPDTKAEMLMRLAELYWQQSKYEFNLEMADFDKLYEEWFNLPRAKQKKAEEPKVTPTTSRKYTRKAIENYRILLKNYPRYSRIDEAVFFLAFSLNDMGEEKDALEMYNRLVKTYPKSDFLADSFNAIGEYYFAHNNAFKALQAYKRAAAYKDTKIYTFALYKMGWCYYNVGEFGTAIDTMKELIAETDRRIEATGGDTGISLKDEALRDLVLFFSEEGDLEAAKEYFTRYGEKKYYRKMLARLGRIYSQQGKNELAVQTYRTLISENPYASDNPDHQNAIIKAYWGRDQFDEANEEINKLVQVYGRTGRWAEENSENREALRESERVIEKNLRNLAVDSHQQALKRRSSKLLLLAEENYHRYLGYFAKGGKTYEIRYWYAEVLYKLKKYDVATGEYEKVVQMDPKGKFLKDAAGNAVFAIEKHIKRKEASWKRADAKQRKKQLSEKDPKRKYAEIALREWESRLIDACDSYAKHLPDDEKSLNLLYKAAYVLHDHNMFKESNKRFLGIIDANAKSEMAQFSVHIILSSYGKIEAWTELNDVARRFHNNPDVGKTKKFKKELKDIYQRASFKIAEGKAAEEMWADAAKAFHDFYSEFGESKIRDLALYNSSFYFSKAGSKLRSVELRHEFIDNFPKPLGKDTAKSRLYEKSVSILADHYKSIADYRKSADLYRRLYDADEGFELDGFTTAKDALYNAALFREGAGTLDSAIQDFTDYVKAWPDSDDALVTRLRIANLLAEGGKTDQAMAAFKAIYSDKKVAGSAFEQTMEAYISYGHLLREKGEHKAELKHYQTALRYFSETNKKAGDDAGLAPFHAAEMEFVLLEPSFAEYATIAMAADTKKGKKALQAKSKGVAELERQYVGILNLKQGVWGIAALYRIGSLYADFADKLKTAPCPKKLNEDQCMIYQFSLEDKAYPLIDKAVDAFTKAREKSYELGLYTDYTVKSLEALSTLRPEEYPQNAEQYPVPDFSSNPYLTAGFID
jgi:tetratricopeptide (TPR) repeat protein